MKTLTPEYFGLTALPRVAVANSTALPDLALPILRQPGPGLLGG